jgi:hypothetical protein
MTTAAPSLLEIERAMRASLVSHEDDGIAPHVAEGGVPAAGRLHVYGNTFAGVLTTALRISYPAVQRLVGAEFFEGAARVFLESSPPDSACLDDYGEKFPGFLSGFEPAASLAYLSDVARLEWAVNRALHARDCAPLDVRRLAALADDERGKVRFEPHPSAGLVRVDHPADLIWRAVLEEDSAALSAIDPHAGPAWLFVQRRPGGVDVRRMNVHAWQFTAALCAGQPLAQAFDLAHDFETSALLAEHLAAGLFVDFNLAVPANPIPLGNPS